MKRFILLSSLVVFTASLADVAHAQKAKPAAGGAGVAALRAMWQTQSGYLLRAAEQMPDSDYAFRPVASVRTFGQLIGHVAGSQNLICAAALGEPSKSEDDIEKSVTTKPGLIAALRASTEYCRRAYALSDASAARSTTLFGEQQSRMFALALNATHDGEHYGNIVTYFRIRGMTPPSSQPAP
jgi:uncharacterized damage-inducible protein DinB